MSVTLTCEQCGAQYERIASRASGSRYCSRECRAKARIALVTKTCAVCGREFSVVRSEAARQVTCSRECRAKARRKDPVPVTCVVCGKTFAVEPWESSRRLVCSAACRAAKAAANPHHTDGLRAYRARRAAELDRQRPAADVAAEQSPDEPRPVSVRRGVVQLARRAVATCPKCSGNWWGRDEDGDPRCEVCGYVTPTYALAAG